MKKLVSITGCFLMLCNFIMYALLPSMPQTAATTPQTDTAELSEPTSLESQESNVSEEVYILKAYNGRLAVFRGVSAVPSMETDVRIADLPPADIELLKSGIAVQSLSELNRLLEDYCS